MQIPLLLSTLLSLSLPITARTINRPKSGCNQPLPSEITLGKSKNQTISSQSGHTPRKYRIRVPKNYNNNVPVPLILSFHGRNKDMKFQEKLSKFSNEEYGFNGISVYPEGVPVHSSIPIYSIVGWVTDLYSRAYQKAQSNGKVIPKPQTPYQILPSPMSSSTLSSLPTASTPRASTQQENPTAAASLTFSPATQQLRPALQLLPLWLRLSTLTRLQNHFHRARSRHLALWSRSWNSMA